jgi:hypothetical protein
MVILASSSMARNCPQVVLSISLMLGILLSFSGLKTLLELVAERELLRLL